MPNLKTTNSDDIKSRFQSIIDNNKARLEGLRKEEDKKPSVSMHDFENYYNFEWIRKQRENNKKEIADLIKRIREVEPKYVRLKLNKSVEEISAINKEIATLKKSLTKELENAIASQARFFTQLKTPEEMYYYYRLLDQDPIDSEYSNKEIEIHDKYIASVPAFKTMIKTYEDSMLEPKKENDVPAAKEESEKENDIPVEEEESEKENDAPVEEEESEKEADNSKNEEVNEEDSQKLVLGTILDDEVKDPVIPTTPDDVQTPFSLGAMLNSAAKGNDEPFKPIMPKVEVPATDITRTMDVDLSNIPEEDNVVIDNQGNQEDPLSMFVDEHGAPLFGPKM